MKYTIIKARTNEICLKEVDEETALKYLKITKRLLGEKIINKELIRGTWRVEAVGQDAKIQRVKPGRFGEEWMEWFAEQWESIRRRYGVGNG